MDIVEEAARETFSQKREKDPIKFQTIITKYNGVVTINGFRRVKKKDGTISTIWSFVEGDNDEFWSSGFMLEQFADKLLAKADNDCYVVDSALKKKSVKIKIFEDRSKAGKSFWNIRCIGYVIFDKIPEVDHSEPNDDEFFEDDDVLPF